MNSRRLIVELPVEDKAYQRTNECDELPPPHGLSPRPGSQKTITGLEWVGGVHRNKKNTSYVRFGSKADFAPCFDFVRFTPESGH